jgi:putative transposase
MPNYRRNRIMGGTYFFTVVTKDRRACLCEERLRNVLRDAITHVRVSLPFEIDAWVLLPDHLHCLWTLPRGDHDYPTRWRLIKTWVTQHGTSAGKLMEARKNSDKKGRESLWQPRYWEHTIRDDEDFASHCDYIHFNPVKHGLSERPSDWPYSTFHRFVAAGIYPHDWASGGTPLLAENAGME